MDCIFCKIANGEIPATKVYEDETVVAFNDLEPQAPTHILVIPKMHITSAADITEENSGVIAHIFEVIAKLSKDSGMDDGFRVVNNCGDSAGQTVKHIHFHLLSGREFTWPAGEYAKRMPTKMKRPMLICGVTAVVISSLLMISQKLLLPLLFASALVFVFYFIKPLKLRPYIIIPFCCICTALLCTSFAIYNRTQISPHLKYDGMVSDIGGKIISVLNEDEFGSDFIIKADNINGEKVNVKIKINVPKNTNFTTYNYISIKNALIKIDKNEENKIDSTSFSQDSFLYCEATNITVLW
jgi:histidine triad (HIT) family protein